MKNKLIFLISVLTYISLSLADTKEQNKDLGYRFKWNEKDRRGKCLRGCLKSPLDVDLLDFAPSLHHQGDQQWQGRTVIHQT